MYQPSGRNVIRRYDVFPDDGASRKLPSEFRRTNGRLRQGHYLLSVHVDDAHEASRVRSIMADEGGEDISTGSEAGAPAEQNR